MDEIKSEVWFSENVLYSIGLQNVKISPEDQKKASGKSYVFRRTAHFLYQTNG
jgi:hypothetical protein